MNKFVTKAVQKISQMDSKQIVAIIKDLDGDIQTLEAVLDSMRDGVILCRKNESVVYVNGRCREMVSFFRAPQGRSYEGMQLSSVIDDKEVLAFVEQAREKQDEEGNTRDFNFQRGSEVRTISLQVVTNEALKGGSFLVLFSDVTERNMAVAKLHQNEYLASMTTMAASIAHEIKNPLAAMSIHVQLMEKHLKKNGSMTEAEADRYLKVLDEEIGRLNSIVVDFLFAVRPMNTQLRLGDLRATIQNVVDFVKPEMKEHGVKVVTVFSSSVTRVEYDDKLVTQVLLNLVKNAMNAMKDGGTVTLSLELDGDNVLLKVADTGCGIPEENISKIFEPYFTTKSDGTGLGLTIVYKVMKEHKGDVSVVSKVGEGSCFTLSFPVPESQRLSLPKENIMIESPVEVVKE
jgi:two-component system, sporulation sensor kinase E